MEANTGGGGSLEERYAEVRKAVRQDLQQAVSQARQIAPEASKAELPRLRLNVDLWPPLFMSGAVVEYEARRIESLQAGRFVLSVHAGGVAVCRFLEWTYDGEELKVITKLGPNSFSGQVLPARSLVGVVTRVMLPDGGDVDPHQFVLADYLSGVMNDYGTTTVGRKVARAAREALANLTAKPEKRYQQATLFSLWRELMQEEARRRKEEAKEKPAAPVEAPLELGSTPDALLRQMGYRAVD